MLWPTISNILSPSEEEEQAIRPINKREALNQRMPASLFCHCTEFTARSIVKCGLKKLDCGEDITVARFSFCIEQLRQNIHATLSVLMIHVIPMTADFLLLELAYLSLPL